MQEQQNEKKEKKTWQRIIILKMQQKSKVQMNRHVCADSLYCLSLVLEFEAAKAWHTDFTGSDGLGMHPLQTIHQLHYPRVFQQTPSWYCTLAFGHFNDTCTTRNSNAQRYIRYNCHNLCAVSSY